MATHHMEWRLPMEIKHMEIYQIKVFLDLAVFLDHSAFLFGTRDKILKQLLIMELFAMVFLFPKDAKNMFDKRDIYRGSQIRHQFKMAHFKWAQLNIVHYYAFRSNLKCRTVQFSL